MDVQHLLQGRLSYVDVQLLWKRTFVNRGCTTSLEKDVCQMWMYNIFGKGRLSYVDVQLLWKRTFVNRGCTTSLEKDVCQPWMYNIFEKEVFKTCMYNICVLYFKTRTYVKCGCTIGTSNLSDLFTSTGYLFIGSHIEGTRFFFFFPQFFEEINLKI